MKSMKVQKARREAESVKQEFRDYESFFKKKRTAIYEVLTCQFGVNVERSIFVSDLPESDSNLGITLINQNGEICFFDIFLDSPELNEVEKVHIEEYVKTAYFKKLKPWHDLVMGIELYREEMQTVGNNTSPGEQ